MIEIALSESPIAVLDADAIAYIAASICEKSTDILLSGGNTIKGKMYFRQETGYRVIDNHLYKIEDALHPQNCKSFLSNSNPSTNYRYDVKGAPKPYKGNRKDKPFFLPHMRSYFMNNYGAEICKKGEADDTIGILAYDAYECAANTGKPIDMVLCGIDKDFKQFPGYFFNIKTGVMTYSDHLGYLTYEKNKIDGRGFLFFCAQMIMGDVADNIGGIYGCGGKKAYDTLKDCVDYKEAWQSVVDLYRCKGIADCVIKATSSLLWITHIQGRLLPHHHDVRYWL